MLKVEEFLEVSKHKGLDKKSKGTCFGEKFIPCQTKAYSR
jgi:hypothetical protein